MMMRKITPLLQDEEGKQPGGRAGVGEVGDWGGVEGRGPKEGPEEGYV